jgi:hypothetical protein
MKGAKMKAINLLKKVLMPVLNYTSDSDRERIISKGGGRL